MEKNNTKIEELIEMWLHNHSWARDSENPYSRIDNVYHGYTILTKEGKMLKLEENEVDRAIDGMKNLDYIKWLKMISHYRRDHYKYKNDVLNNLKNLINEYFPAFVKEDYRIEPEDGSEPYWVGHMGWDTWENRFYKSKRFIENNSIIRETLEKLKVDCKTYLHEVL